jgi:2-amino-4-hydroxy-6-hydroxymethyldihydropteridine diphosphokinase
MSSSHAELLAEPVQAYLGLGANLGDAVATLRWAIAAIADFPQVQVLACSSLYRSAPVDSSGPDYINAVVGISCRQPSYRLLRMLQELEQTAGRTRPYRNAPRTLDLDLLLFGSASIQSEWLTLPHPRMRERAFVLQPLHEIAPQLVTSEALAAVQSQRIERLHQP